MFNSHSFTIWKCHTYAKKNEELCWNFFKTKQKAYHKTVRKAVRHLEFYHLKVGVVHIYVKGNKKLKASEAAASKKKSGVQVQQA